MSCPLTSVGVFSAPTAELLLMVHLLVAVFALGTVTHHWWHLACCRNVQPARLARYAGWMAIGYPLAWLAGILIYPSYNVLIRKPPLGVLEVTTRWAVGMFEIKEHAGTIAVAMLPWLLLSARNYGQLGKCERISYQAATWVFTLFVYYAFVTGGLVTMIKCF